MRWIMLALGLASVGAGRAQPAQREPESPQATRPALIDTEAHRAEAVQRLATALEENYVFPDFARRYAQTIRAKLLAGGYTNLGENFAATVTADLQAVHPDRHLRIGRSPSPGGSGPRMMRTPSSSSQIDASGWIADGVAFISFRSFPGDPETLETLRRFLQLHQDARALIFDLRNNRGGGTAELDLISSWIFARETLLLAGDTRLEVDQRRESPVPDRPTLRRATGPAGVVRRLQYAVPSEPATPLRSARVFVLVSSHTASAAEHFAMALKRTQRATLIGETTAGFGNYGEAVDIGYGYIAFIPIGRTFDPDTGEGWEGVGVVPNVSVPAERALEEALGRLGVTPAQRHPLDNVGALSN